MLAFAEMLTEPAKKAGIEVPPKADDYDPQKFPRWHVFCNAQLARAIQRPGCQWDNAKLVAELPEEKLRTITFGGLVDAGWVL